MTDRAVLGNLFIAAHGKGLQMAAGKIHDLLHNAHRETSCYMA